VTVSDQAITYERDYAGEGESKDGRAMRAVGMVVPAH